MNPRVQTIKRLSGMSSNATALITIFTTIYRRTVRYPSSDTILTKTICDKFNFDRKHWMCFLSPIGRLPCNIFTPIEDKFGYYAKVPDLPGCITTGNSLADAIDQITDAMNAWLVVAEDEGIEIAPPTPQDKLTAGTDSIFSLVSADTRECQTQ